MYITTVYTLYSVLPQCDTEVTELTLYSSGRNNATAGRRTGVEPSTRLAGAGRVIVPIWMDSRAKSDATFRKETPRGGFGPEYRP